MKKILMVTGFLLCGMTGLNAQNPVFRGIWNAENDSTRVNLNINLYSETVKAPNGQLCKGFMEVIKNDSVTSSLIVRSAVVESNKANITFYNPGDSILYQAILVVNAGRQSIRMMDFDARNKPGRQRVVLPGIIDLYKTYK